MVTLDSVWITGSTRSGKTTRLIEQFLAWSNASPGQRWQVMPTILVFAATGDNRIELADRLAEATQGRYRFDSTTPLGFLQDEVILFYPLLIQQLNLKAHFPLRLRPETEQELATRLWQPELEAGILKLEGVSDYFMVRRSLDLLQLCANSGTPIEDIPTILKDGFSETIGSAAVWEAIGEALRRWRSWCLGRGLLTYGLITELYWRHLLPHPTYQQHLRRRYRAVVADDVDEYPAIARQLFEILLDQGMPGAFSYNPNGGIRMGVGADPTDLAMLADRCHVEQLPHPVEPCLGAEWGKAIPTWIDAPMLPDLPASIQTIQTVSRAELLRQTAETIVAAVESGQVQPEDVAVIGPGVDAIARYTLKTILNSRGIAVESLNDQRPLISSPMIRAVLSLLALVYPGLGRMLSRDAVAEMLVVLSQTPGTSPEAAGLATASIDPVRAGLLVDYCFVPDPAQPQLLPSTTFPRWDRLGYQATQAYEAMRQWIETQQQEQVQRLIPSPVVLIDRAIQRFLYGGSQLPYDQLAALRELVETAQHYWDIDKRLQQSDRIDAPASTSVGQFIQLLQNGTITADPYPVRPIGKSNQAVTVSTIFQYRANRRHHRWQFWLDAGSPFWLSGGGPLFGAPLFLRDWPGRPWTAQDSLLADQERLQRQVLDLLCRVSDRVYLCHSDLATSGQEQAGSLLGLVNAAVPLQAPVSVAR
ncbi:recombinase family protein [Oculatella sp. LEGE 06141]|uniref:recombinase family protein n=1 Tax=Oculatella sp. LEGE 06141 TaxID=1828648 RepID=UPI00187EAC53|nr:recombinase family protein [Oculatella sp. LEGE 06141]MBE9180976.1 recombinase family protein [Oculatella sp. LEGE 06141]